MRTRDDLRTWSWKRVRLLVLERDGWLCQIRGPHCTTHATTVDHVVPHALGGNLTTGLRAACRPCNASLGGRLGTQLRQARQRRARRADAAEPFRSRW